MARKRKHSLSVRSVTDFVTRQ